MIRYKMHLLCVSINIRLLFSVILLLAVIEPTKSSQKFQNLRSFITESGGSMWAILVAGSKGYQNYRYQTDVLHIYHVLVSRGVPRSQIITMMYDDIAYSPDNPFPGKLFNIPGGPDVYDGVTIDYRLEAVAPDTLLDVLTPNNKMMNENRTVLKSTNNDNVLLYFAEHGANGLLPIGKNFLYLDKLLNTFFKMYRKRMYKKMVVYLESNGAGYKFRKRLAKANIYVATASDLAEKSYACFWNDTLKTFMANNFSIAWLLNSDRTCEPSETSFKQYTVLRDLTNLSHVMPYEPPLYDDCEQYEEMHSRRQSFNGEETIRRVKTLLTKEKPVRQDEAHIVSLNRQLQSEEGELKNENLKKLYEVLQQKVIANKIVKSIIKKVNGKSGFVQDMETENKQTINFKCYRFILRYFRAKCVRTIDFENYDVIRHFYKFSNLCRQKKFSMKSVRHSIRKTCRTYFKLIKHEHFEKIA